MDALYYNGAPVEHPSVETCDICGRVTDGPCTATHFCDSCESPTENTLNDDAVLYCDRCAERVRLRDEADAVALANGLEPWEVA